MELSFATRKLRSQCQDNNKAIADLGDLMAGQLKLRVADLRAARTAAELPAQLIGSSRGAVFRIPLTEDGCLTVTANHRKIPASASAKINWTKVTRVKLTIETSDADR